MKIRRSCMRDEVRDLVVERILNGVYPAGTRLKELALASECNVSQAPVREALRDLEALGLVQSERYRGTRVRAANGIQLREAYELRALLEERAAQLAVPCSAEVLKGLHRQMQRMQRGVARRDYKTHADAVTAFHRLLVAASGNTTFLRAWDSLHWEVRSRIAGQQLRDRGIDLQSFVDVHEVILASLETGDGHAAGRGLRELIERVMTVIDTDLSPGAVVAVSKPARRAAAKKIGI
jgi:DNA-binding GntR family transcriptional regulator